MRYWLVKSDPEEFSFDDLWAAPGRRTAWEGVRNFQARNFLRDGMRVGDGVLFYHSSSDPTGVVGLAEVVRAAYSDPTQFEQGHAHHDPASSPQDPRWVAVDLRGARRLERVVALDKLRKNPALAGMVVLQRGSRLSVTPVTAAEWRAVLCLGEAGGRGQTPGGGRPQPSGQAPAGQRLTGSKPAGGARGSKRARRAKA